MYFSTYLMFNGACRDAFAFYKQAIGGEIVMMSTYGESPVAEHMKPEDLNGIIHARLVVGSAVLMGCDTPSDRRQTLGGFGITIQVDSNEEADRIFTGLSDGATITMPLGETFWSNRFGMLTDKFGVDWMINHEKAQF